MNVYKFISWLFLLFVSNSLLTAQDRYTIIVGKDTTVIQDSLAYVTHLDSVQGLLWHQGYYDRNTEEVLRDEEKIAIVDPQREYVFRDVVADTSMSFVPASMRMVSRLRGVSASSANIASFGRRAIAYCSSRGYPMASLKVKNITIDDHNIDGVICLERGKKILFDTLHVRTKDQLNIVLLHRLSGFRTGDLFDMSKVERLEKRINKSRYYRVKESPNVKILGDRGVVDFYVEKRPSSRFDFIVGLAPQQDNNVTTYLFTGEILMETRNLLDRGEYLYANIKRVTRDNQSLKISAAYPYLFDLPYTISGGLRIFRNGSDFLNLESELGVGVSAAEDLSFSASYYYNTSSLITIDSVSLLRRKALPTALDNKKRGISLSLTYDDLDSYVNPTEGWRTSLTTKVGSKRILKNNEITVLRLPAIDFAAAYDTIKLSNTQLSIDMGADYYQRVGGVFSLKYALSGGYIYDSGRVLENEYYRLGGYRSLRGFDEQSILARRYLRASVESRIILGELSYLSLPFIDYGYTQVAMGDELIWDHALGLGMGMVFGTNVGLFNVSFAVGRRLEQRFDFGKIRVHFGYVSTF